MKDSYILFPTSELLCCFPGMASDFIWLEKCFSDTVYNCGKIMLTLEAPNTTIAEFSNTADADETAHN